MGEEELQGLKDRIEKRKLVREQQIAERAIREKKRQEEEKAERIRKEEEEERKKKEEEKKKNALAAMSMNFGGAAQRQNNRKGKRAQDKEKKKKILAERRKQLNVDHLSGEKLQEKAIDLHKWLTFLEESKFDHEENHERQKYDVKSLRLRVNYLMGKDNKKKVNIRKQTNSHTLYNILLPHLYQSTFYAFNYLFQYNYII